MRTEIGRLRYLVLMNDSSAPAAPAGQAGLKAHRPPPAIRGLALATRISLLLLAVVTVASLGLAWFNQQVILTKFAETELRLVLQNRTILERAIATEEDHLRAVVTDWAQWDDLYAFVQGQNPEFGEAELGDVVLDRLELDTILMIDPDGRLHYGDLRLGDSSGSAGSGAGAAVQLGQWLTGNTSRHGSTQASQSTLSLLAGSRETVAGLLDTPEGPMVLALRPISRTDGSGDAVGTLVMGRFLNATSLFSQISVLPSTVIAHGGGRNELVEGMHGIAEALARSSDGTRLVTRRDDMSDFKMLRGLTGDPVQILETRMPRSIVATGRETTQLMFMGLLVAAAILILILIALVRGIVSTPLQRLTVHIRTLHEGGERQATPGQDRNDEIGVLARRLDELEAVRHANEVRLRLLATAVECAGKAIAILDADGRIGYVNPQYERQTGFSLAEVIGKFPSRGQSPLATYDGLWATVKAGHNWSGLLQARARDGSIRQEEVTVAPIKNDNAEITNFIAIMHDVTESQQLQVRLAEAQKLEAIGRLAAGVAHEINTPTQYISGNIRFLQEAFRDVEVLLKELMGLAQQAGGAVPVAELNKALSKADISFLRAEVPVAIGQSLEGVERVAGIVKSMRELSHPTHGLLPSDLNAVVESAVRMAGNEWQGVAEVLTDLDPDLPHVPCQPGEINQVIVNMLVNAVHATELSRSQRAGRPGRILVATRRVDDAAEIRISDDGSGMSPEVRDRVFDPFFTTKEVGRGTGQGLAIARGIVKKHNGTITVESTPGRGTCFTIRLPLASELAVSAASDGAAAA